MPDETAQTRQPALRDPAADVIAADPAEVVSGAQLERIVAYLEVQIADLDRRERRLHSDLAALDSERRLLRREMQQFDESAQERDALLKQREHDVAERESGAQSVTERLREEQEQLSQDRSRLEIERAELHDEQSTWRERCAEEHVARQRELDERETQINRQTVDLEKRTRFHEEHLEKLRQDLARQQHELTVARQQDRARREQEEDRIRRRLAQLRRYRKLIEQRDVEARTRLDALHAEENRRRKEFADQLELLAQERARFGNDCSARLLELEERTGHLRAMENELEQRAARLETARADLQRTQRECTASHAAAELAWNQLCKTVGADEAGQRLEQQRQLVDERLQVWEQDHAGRLRELRQAAEELQQKRDAIRDVTATQLDRLARREEALRVREAAVERTLVRLAARSQHNPGPASSEPQDSIATDQAAGALESDAA